MNEREKRLKEFAKKWGNDGIPHPASLPLGMGQALTIHQVKEDLDEYDRIISKRREIYHY